MPRLSPDRAAQLAVGILLLIVVRSLGEFLRLYDAAAVGKHSALLVYVIGALVAAIAAICTLTLYALGRCRTAILVAALTTVGLLIYKVALANS